MGACLPTLRPLPSTNAEMIDERSFVINSNEQRTSTPIPSRRCDPISDLTEAQYGRTHLRQAYWDTQTVNQQRTAYLDEMSDILSRRRDGMVGMRDGHECMLQQLQRSHELELQHLVQTQSAEMQQLQQKLDGDLQEATDRYYWEIRELEARHVMDSNDEAIHQNAIGTIAYQVEHHLPHGHDYFEWNEDRAVSAFVDRPYAPSYSDFRHGLNTTDQQPIQLEDDIPNEILEQSSFASLDDFDELRPDELEFYPNSELEQQVMYLQPLFDEDVYESNVLADSFDLIRARLERHLQQPLFDEDDDERNTSIALLNDTEVYRHPYEQEMDEAEVHPSIEFHPQERLPLMDDSLEWLWAEFAAQQEIFEVLQSVSDEDDDESNAPFASEQPLDRPEHLWAVEGRRDGSGDWLSDDEDEENLEEPNQADVANAAATRELIRELRRENEESAHLHFSRSCPVCYTESPLQRAVFSDCGHVLCLACAEHLDLATREERRVLECPFCRERGPFVKLYEHVVEEEEVES